MSRPGFANLGNTCFMNSLLQVLIDIDEFNIVFSGNRKDNLLKSFNNLYNESRSKTGVIIPRDFHNKLQLYAVKYKNKVLTGYSQNDCSELLIFLFDVFHDDLKREVLMNINGTSEGELDDLAIKCYDFKKKSLEKEYSEIYDVFYFIQVEQIVNSSNKISSQILSWHCQLGLYLPEKNKNNLTIKLIDCIKNNFEDVCYLDDKKENAKKIHHVWNFPTVLVIVLQRFFNYNKNNILVDFPLNDLDLSEYVIGYNKNSYVYDLMGICNHSGNIHGGHYTAYSKTRNNWYLYNDSGTSLVKDVSILKSNNAYCLFYRKKNII
uniref:USP domain-containing protein n=1 Tax=viral metagenome TaxID=1070528 RepID=A0A6C0AW55_9ZZZZ